MGWFGARRDRYEEQLDDEMRFHLERQIADYVAEGMSPEAARRRALIEFGGPAQIKEECREVRRVNPAGDLTQDIRYGVRMIRKRPGIAAVAVMTLALGIGANSAVFSMLNALLLRPLDFPELDRLVEIREVDPHRPLEPLAASPADYLDWKKRSTSFGHLAAYVLHDYNLTGAGGEPEVLRGMRVTTDFLQTLRVKTALGRDFHTGEDERGQEQVAILTDALWRRRFASDPMIVGRTILLDSQTFLVVGVLRPGFDFPFPGIGLLSPLALSPSDRTDSA